MPAAAGGTGTGFQYNCGGATRDSPRSSIAFEYRQWEFAVRSSIRNGLPPSDLQAVNGDQAEMVGNSRSFQIERLQFARVAAVLLQPVGVGVGVGVGVNVGAGRGRSRAGSLLAGDDRRSGGCRAGG
eukprot:COSAG02_NODE_2605_length_8442_cov_9.552080_2_plen_127_part_00